MVLNRKPTPTPKFRHLFFVHSLVGLESVIHIILKLLKLGKKTDSFPHMPSRPNRFMVSSNCYINMLFIDLLPFPQGILHMYLFYQYRVSATQHERTCVNSSFVWYTVHFFHMWTLLGQMLKLFPCLIYKGRCQTDDIGIW